MFKSEAFLTSTLRKHPHGTAVTRILAATFNAVDPGKAVEKYLKEHPIQTSKRVFAFGLGKAAILMTKALTDSIHVDETLIITKHASPLTVPSATVILGDHPIPGDNSLVAGQAALEFVSRLTADDLLICLISGGGSSLMTAPVIPLNDLRSLTSSLLASGARVDEINMIRRHLDLLKGGGLAQSANGAQIISLILSDVVGDPIEAIASGPTAPDPSALEDAMNILQKYRLDMSFKENLRETVKPSNNIFKHTQNEIIASNYIALQAVGTQAKLEGFSVKIIDTELQGEACEVGHQIANLLKEELEKQKRPFCLLAGGETTVTIKGKGKGGRNQELVLSTVDILREMKDVMLLAIASDGEDGPTDAAGAVATNESKNRAGELRINPNDYLKRNDSYTFFNQLDDLIKIGPSGTNVNDLVLCIAF